MLVLCMPGPQQLLVSLALLHNQLQSVTTNTCHGEWARAMQGLLAWPPSAQDPPVPCCVRYREEVMWRHWQ